MNVAFVTFANGDFAKSLDRIRYQAIDSRFFNKFFVYTESDLPEALKAFCESNKHLGKGYGFYIWKPFLVNRVAQMPELQGSIVFWIDAGCWVNKFGVDNFTHYLNLMTEEKPFLAFESYTATIKNLTKRDALVAFNGFPHMDDNILFATAFGFRVNTLSRTVLQDWINRCVADPELLYTSPSKSGPELEGFNFNDYDMGSFSLVMKNSGGLNILSAEEHIFPGDGMKQTWFTEKWPYPILAMRDRPRSAVHYVDCWYTDWSPGQPLGGPGFRF